MNQKAVASTEASKARDRVGFGLTHRKEFFFSCLPFGRGDTLPASLLEAGASFRHAQHDPKHPNLPAFSIITCYSKDGADSGTCTAKRARQLRKQVGRLRPGQAAPRWLSLCSPRPGKKRIEASSHARADGTMHFFYICGVRYARTIVNSHHVS